MSDSSDDDDLPDLESVDSSEYYTDEDEDSDMVSDLEELEIKKEPEPATGIDKSSSFYAVARKWLELDHSEIEKQLLVVSVHLFSPFLFGHAHQSDRWLRWCHEVGLLVSEFDYTTKSLTPVELTAVDVLDKAMEHCRNCMMDRESPDSLFMLLELANDIKNFESVKEAVSQAKHRDCFKSMLEAYASDTSGIGRISNDELGKHNFLEIGCLYAINQTAEHVQKYVDGHDLSKEFDESVASHTKSGEDMKKQGDDLFTAGKSQQAIEVYTTAIICCPYYYDLYLKRALVYLELQKFRDALADSLRAIHLNPSHTEGHIRYIQCLTAWREDPKRLAVAQRQYNTLFPGPRYREQLKIGLDSSPVYKRRKIVATEEDRAHYDKLTFLCKQASEAYLQGNVDNALLYYDESIRVSSQDKGWQHCMVLSDSQRFMVSLHFAYGLALLKKGSRETTKSAIEQFNIILEQYSMVIFPPALYGLGKALAQLHRHFEALDKAKEGLELLPSYHLPVSLHWPGTDEIMTEALAQNVELLLQQLQQQCEPVNLPDAVCRYGNCLQYHTSTDIQVSAAKDYKGHVLLQCVENCSISYHASCWRRFKTEGITGADKDHLGSDCPTPDCRGTIKTVTVYDNRGKVKIKYESETPVKKAPPTSLSFVSLKDQGKEQAKDSTRRSSRSKPLRKKKSGSTSANMDTPGSDDVAKELGAKSEKGEGPGGGGEEQEVWSQEDEGAGGGKVPAEVSEDVRKTEDSLAVINRHAEAEDEKEMGGARSKAKKKKPKSVSSSSSSSMTQRIHSELFTLPDRHVEEIPEDEETAKPGNWQCDPEHPFNPPEHLREAVDHFEKTEVPRLGLKPIPVATPISSEEGAPTTSSIPIPADVEFVLSYFSEILKNCGPLKASDPRLTEPLSYLPEEKTQLITLSGGLEKFLLSSPSFVADGDIIFLAEDAPVIRDSISQSSSTTSSTSSLGTDPLMNPATEKNARKVVQVSSVASHVDVHIVGSQTVNKGNSHSSSSGSGRYTPNDSAAAGRDRQPSSLSSLIDSQHHTQDTLSGGLKFDGSAMKLNPTKTYGVELGSGLNSPSNSPLDSPRMMSPTDLVNLNNTDSNRNSGGSGTGTGIGNVKQQKLGSVAHGSTKRPDSAGERRGRENIPPRDVNTSSSSRGLQQNTKSTLSSSSSSSTSSGGSSRAVGYERQKKKEQQPSSHRRQTSRESEKRDNAGGGGRKEKEKEKEKEEEGREKLSSSSTSRLLSSASDSGELGVLGEFFGHATASGDGTGSGTGSRSGSGSGSGSQGDESPPPSTSTPALANSKLFRAAVSSTTTSAASTSADSDKETSTLGKETTKVTSSAAIATTSVRVETRDAIVQTLRLKTGVKFVQTDPLPSVENFKERYERVLKEKKDLQVKLERSEDQKFKMQRDHKREVDKLEKKYYTEARKEAEGKIHDLEERIIEERQKGQASKKDQADLIRSHKAEIKSLMEKVEKLKKDLEKKDVMIDTSMVQYRSEVDHLRSEKRRYDERIRSEVDKSQKSLRRALEAEVEVLNMRRDVVARPCEQRLKEVEAMCTNIPQGSEFHRDWLSFRDKLRTSLDCFHNAMDDQLRQVRSGRELANLDRVPNPNLPVPAQLRVPMPMMRPRFMPMMPMRAGPLPPGAIPGGLVMDPGAFAQPRMPVHTMAPVQMSMSGPHLQPVECAGSLPSGTEPPTSTSDLFAADKTPSHDIPASAQHVPSGGGGGRDAESEPSRGGAVGGAVGGATSSRGGGGGDAATGGGGKKKSSFERIVEKLAPVYPHYAREDFKSVLQEVRRNNKNTLSGLSLESITEQVKAIINSKDKGRGSSSSSSSSSKGATGSGGGNSSKGRQNKSRTSSRQQQGAPSRRPRQQAAVAIADPPVMSSTDYDEDGSCIICYEDMIDFDSSRLNCGHRFHTECIRSWFKEQSTCPTCRNHSLLPEEYPFLK